MSAPVDVLAVLSRRSAELTRKYGADNDLAAVRAAVAELIEADKEYDVARAALTAYLLSGADTRPMSETGLEERFNAADARRTAALARFGGDA